MTTFKKRVEGHRIGNLTLLGEEPIRIQPDGGKERMFRFRCDCGKDVVRIWHSRGRSCGCKRDEAARHNALHLPAGKAAFNLLLNNYRGAARRRNLAFELDPERFGTLTSSDCHYCGKSPSSIMRRGSGQYVYNGIDRIDNSIGYIEGNIVPCCGQCNRAKLDWSHDEFITWIKRVYKHLHLSEEWFKDHQEPAIVCDPSQSV